MIVESMSQAEPPPGRFESIEEGQPYIAIVDYAHTPDGLLQILSTAKEIAQERGGRLLTLFGCGGDRDRGKRPKMGHVVSEWSDYFIITDDNPRTEDPEQIVSDILPGLINQNYEVIHNRRKAIQKLIDLAQNNDVVIMAGKGHETVQLLKSGPIPFDEREEVRSAIRRKIHARVH